MNRKIIIYNGCFELPDKDAASHRMFANARILRKLGYRVIIVGITESILNEKYVFREYEEFECFIVSGPKSNFEKLVLSNNFNMCKHIIDNEMINAVISYNYPSVAFLRLNKFCHSRGVKTFLDITEWYDARGSFFHKLLQKIEIDLRMRYAYYRADALIVISKYLNDFYSKHKMECLYLPSLVEKENDKWKFYTQEYMQDDICKLIYAGVPSATKDSLDIIIELLEHVYKRNNIKFKFEIIGITEEQYKNIYNKAIPRSIRKFINFYGKIAHTQVIKKVAQANFTLIVRKKCRVTDAGFPTKLAESLACGTPVIATDTSNIKDYIEEGSNGFIIDLSEYENCINKLNYILSLSNEKYIHMKKMSTEYTGLDINSYLIETEEFFANNL
jgi:glycosyltransferase involved in cell wall biosynthesis